MPMISLAGTPSAISSCSIAAISLASHSRTRAVSWAFTSAGRLALVEVADDLLQGADAVRAVVDQLAHASSSCSPGRPGR